MNNDNQTKSWNVAATFDNYQDADRCRDTLKEKHTLVKVKRGLNIYRVKTWDPPPKKEIPKKEKKQFKKGANVKRSQKNDNKKVRSGRQKS